MAKLVITLVLSILVLQNVSSAFEFPTSPRHEAIRSIIDYLKSQDIEYSLSENTLRGKSYLGFDIITEQKNRASVVLMIENSSQITAKLYTEVFYPEESSGEFKKWANEHLSSLLERSPSDGIVVLVQVFSSGETVQEILQAMSKDLDALAEQ